VIADYPKGISAPHWSRTSLRTDEPAPFTVRIECSVVQQIGIDMRRHLYSQWPNVPRETGGLLGGVQYGSYGRRDLERSRDARPFGGRRARPARLQ
jgi:hypothetical protein